MKYLSSQPFTIAVSSPRKKTWGDILEQSERDVMRATQEPHEYVGGGICLICGLAEEAPRHTRTAEHTK